MLKISRSVTLVCDEKDEKCLIDMLDPKYLSRSSSQKFLDIVVFDISVDASYWSKFLSTLKEAPFNILLDF